jgi:hypothetical protein
MLAFMVCTLHPLSEFALGSRTTSLWQEGSYEYGIQTGFGGLVSKV